MNPYLVVEELEKRIAEWAGAPYGVAVESGSAAIFLSLMWHKNKYGHIGTVTIPSRTYPSVPCSIIHAGGKVCFTDEAWSGIYRLRPYEIYDSALRFQRGMYIRDSLYCLSFHAKKHLPIGRGGMILTDDKDAYKWLRKARFDGRNECSLKEDCIDSLGYNMYLTPEQAARGLMLFSNIENQHLEDMDVEKQGYSDLSQFKIYGGRNG